MRMGVKIIVGLIVILALIAIGILVSERKSSKVDEAAFCASDVRECPNGSYVSRVPPSCEFAACSTIAATTTRKFERFCELGNCPFDIYEGDSGKSFIYSVTSRFTIFLNEDTRPKTEMKVSCEPKSSIVSVSSAPGVTPPLYPVRYEGVKIGTCTITNKDFSIEVNITD